MPGKAPSQPLNFALKGQVSGSKLVGGFSKPLASIAKIEAAVAVQQSKLDSGKLESTGLMIGDSPGTAFKLDPAVVKQVAEDVKQVIIARQEAEAKTEVPTRDKLDPRFLLAVRASLKLTENSTPDAFEQPIPINLEQVTLSQFLSNQKLGNYTEKNYGAPINIPGNREPSGLMTLLLAQDFEFAIPAINGSPSFFLNAPFIEGKNFVGALALQDIKITESVDFLEPADQNEVGEPVLRNFLLSAGRTITAGSGTLLKANAAIFDVFAAGTGFSPANSRDGFLTEISAPSKVPLELANSMIWNDANGGLLRIQAPEIKFTNQTLSADTIEIGASGPINLAVDSSLLTAMKDFKAQYDVEASKGAAKDPAVLNSILTSARNRQVPLPLGFDGPEALAIQAYKVSIRSTGKAISIVGVPIYTNDLMIATGSVAKIEEEVSVSQNSNLVVLKSTAGVSVGQVVNGLGIPDGTVVTAVNSAEGTVTLSNPVTATDTVTLTIGTSSTAQTDGALTISGVTLKPQQGVGNPSQVFAAHAIGDLTITDSDFTYASTVDLRTNLNANLTSINFQDVEDLSVWADQDITFEAVSITGETATNSKVSVTSKQGNVYLNSSTTNSSLETTLSTDDSNGKTIKVPAYRTQKTVMVAKKVNFTANNGDIVINSYQFGREFVANGSALKASESTVQEFSAKAKKTLGVYNTSIDASKVSLAANTVVLRDVNFVDGADVALRSQTGLVAAGPGASNPVAMGKVNFVSGVYYGPNLIHLPDMPASGDAGFRAALIQKYPTQNFNKLTITDLNRQTKLP